MMKPFCFRTFSALLMPVPFVSFFVVWNVLSEPKPAYILKVRVPTEFKSNLTNLTDEELFDYLKTGDPSPIPESPQPNLLILNGCGTLLISLDQKGNIKINSQDFGNLEDTNHLTDELNQVFQSREQNGVYEPNSDKIFKTVIVKAPRSAKYGEVTKLIDAVKSSGTDPIILQIDDLPQ